MDFSIKSSRACPVLLVAALIAAQQLAAQTPAPLPVDPPGDSLFASVSNGTPQTLAERFQDFAVITVGPRALFTAAAGSGISMIRPRNYPRAWRQGPGAFGRIYGSYLATRASGDTARFVTAALLHEDFRYRASTSGNPVVRVAHAISFTVVDKSESGHSRLAVSNFAAAAAGGFAPNLYLPAGYNTVSRAETRVAISFAVLAGRNIAAEFAPEILKVTRKLHIPAHGIPIAEWWTR